MRLSATFVLINFFIISLGASLGLLSSGPSDRYIYSSNQSEEELQTSLFFSEEDFQLDMGVIALMFIQCFQFFILICCFCLAISVTSQKYSFIKSRPPPAYPV